MLATSVSLAMVAVIGLGTRSGDKVGMALRATARWSFFWFWLASTGGALCVLFGSRFQVLAQRARDFGLAFASAHLVHIGLAGFLLIALAAPFPRSKLIFFSMGAFWIYLLAFLSVKRVAAQVELRTLRIVRTIGVEYIALVFIVDFYPRTGGGISNLVIYLPLLAMAIAGPFLRLAASVKRRAQGRRVAA